MNACKLLASVALLLLAACQSPLSAPRAAAPVGSSHSLTVSWQVGSPTARTILPASCPIPATYDVVLTPASGSAVSQTGLTATNWTISGLASTVYTIAVTGKDSGGNPLVSGTATADLTSGNSQSPNVVLSYNTTAGSGTGQLHLTFAITGPTVTATSLTLVDPAGTVLVNGLALSGTYPTFTYTNTSATVGSYKLFAKFSASGNTALVLNTVLVVRNVDTAVTVPVSAFNNNHIPLWANSVLASSTSDSYAMGLAVDPSGNLWVSGIQGPLPLLSKLSATGTPLTAVAFTSAGAGAALHNVASDSAGNVYIVGGMFYPSATIAGLPVSAGWSAGPTVLIAKINASGNGLWVQSIPSAPYSSYYEAVAVDDTNGFVYAGGRDMNNYTYTFGAINNNSGVSGFFNNFLVVQHNSSTGSPTWVQTPSAGSNSSWVAGLSADSTGVWAAGWITGNSSFTIATKSFAGVSTIDNLALVKFNTAGVAQWAITSAGGTSTLASSHLNAVATDSSQNAYVAGYVTGTGTLNLGGGISVTPVNSSGTATNLLLAKYNSSGTPVWATTITSANSDTVLNSAKVEPNGNLFVGGYINGPSVIDFGSGVTLTGVFPGNNAFVAEYDGTGAILWAKATVSNIASQVYAVAVGSAGQFYAAGTSQYSSPPLDFGNSVSTLGPYNGFNPFLVDYQ